MNHYYAMLHLRLNERISISDDAINVDIRDVSQNDIVTNDQEKQFRSGPKSYFYLSGGGSYVIDGQYLLVIKRDAKTIVNPNKYSLFTGRSNSKHEWINPFLCARELFEEVSFYVDGNLLSLRNQRFQTVIDSSYKNDLKSGRSIPTQIDLVDQPKVVLNIQSELGRETHELTVVVSETGDINCLFIFSLSVSLSQLRALDSENSGIMRKIYVIDTKNLVIKPLENFDKNTWKIVRNFELTENLVATIKHLQ